MRIKLKRKNKLIFILTFSVLLFSSVKGAEKNMHLFILSGQSNMANLNLTDVFIPTIEEKFGKNNVLIIKDSEHGRSIERWYKKPDLNLYYIWRLIKGVPQGTKGELYIRLMKKVQMAIKGRTITSITFVWMQGERDALSKSAAKYRARWDGLMNNLRNDLGGSNINFVIGRLSDFDMNNKKYPHWTRIRNIQVSIATESQLGAWVDTDQFNGASNDLHYSEEGYKLLGKAFAQKAIELITQEKIRP